MKLAPFLKQFVKYFLRKINLAYVPGNVVSGIILSEDLKLTIQNRHPVCFDIGANEGQTIILFKKIFNNPIIYAFEPSGKMFNKLQSKDFGDNVSLYNLALGKEIITKEFINYKNSQLSSFLTLNVNNENRFSDVEIESRELVEVTTVDRFLQEHSISSLDLLKIDTQGFDMDVLLGAIGSFQKGIVKNVLVELNFVRLYNEQSSAPAIIDFLAKYHLFLIDYYEKERRNQTIAWCTALFGRR